MSYFSKSGERERLILSENKKVIQEILVKEIYDERQRIIKKPTQSLTENNNIFDINSFCKLKKKLLFPKHSQTKISVIDSKSIIKEYQREFQERLSPRLMDIDYKELEDSSIELFKLTLPVRRYLVPTPSTKGGGEPTPYDLGNGRLYKVQLWQAIRIIYER